MTPPDAPWIAADWGTSRLRLWQMQGVQVLDERASGDGMGRLAPAEFEPAILALAGEWIKAETTVVACGMVGARQGWIEAPYRSLPAPPLGGPLKEAPAQLADLRVWIVPGLQQSTPPDVMRGEETQIAGFLASHPTWEGTLCLPGTHTKWVKIAGGQVRSFRTFLTGELFAVLGEHSVLRHSLSEGAFDAYTFEAGVRSGFEFPERLLSDLFAIRAENLLHGISGATARGKLSGLLIGCELAGTRPSWQDRGVVIIGNPTLTDLYARALAALGKQAENHDGSRATLSGLIRAFTSITPKRIS